jgi:hypothetical protein
MVCVVTTPALLSAQDSVAIIPRPAHITMGKGAFHIGHSTEILVLHAGRQIGDQLAD